MSALKKILYVEDEPDIQAIARMALERIGGFTVKVCSSGEEALQTAVDFAPDMILLDVMMPGMDGPTTLKALQGFPALVDVPMAFMTAKVQPSEIAHLKSLGVRDVIAKPFNPLTLAAQITALWEQK
jgi:two-component system OmpR family response regulator